MAAALKKDLPSAPNSAGALSFEHGVLKIDGAVGDYRELRDVIVRDHPVAEARIGSVLTDREPWADAEARSAVNGSPGFLVNRQGAIVQIGNILSAPNGTPLILQLTTVGPLAFGSEAKGGAYSLKDSNGRSVPRAQGVGFSNDGLTSKGRQRFSFAQLEATQRLLAALCKTNPRLRIGITPYLKETLLMQQAVLPKDHCA